MTNNGRQTMSKKALCIGINDYPGTQNDLSGCVNDANDWAAALAARGFAVTKLIDAQATKAAMVSAISGLVGGAAKGDSVVITYSGHGTWVPDQNGDEPDGRDEGLCPWDIGSGKVLLDDEIAVLFAHRAAGVRVLLISDSCHSGSVTKGDSGDLDAGMPRARFLPPSVWMKAGELPASRVSSLPVISGLSRAAPTAPSPTTPSRPSPRCQPGPATPSGSRPSPPPTCPPTSCPRTRSSSAAARPAPGRCLPDGAPPVSPS